ncbi:phage tail terminator-like protein [Chromobacterium sp.]|uniref:phage tail terminator-like protein n=1 Tax=Chromobacterium sp. TaxID=306190 RepID=UPI0035AD7F33
MAIRRALESRLLAWAEAKGLPVAWEALVFNPPASVYLKVFLMPAEPVNMDLDSGFREHGVFQVSICTPSGAGPQQAEALADELRQLFAADEVIGPVRISMTPYRSPGLPSDTHFIVPVTIRYSTI